MFPEYCKEFPGEEIFSYNGYEDIPAYRKAEIPDENGSNVVAKAILSIEENCCGFIEDKIVNYHTCEEDSYFVNMDKKYVFAYFKGVKFDDLFPATILLDFIKFRAESMLLVFEDTHFVLKKTQATYKVCEKLDKIFCADSFTPNVIMKAVGEQNYDDIFYKLLEI